MKGLSITDQTLWLINRCHIFSSYLHEHLYFTSWFTLNYFSKPTSPFTFCIFCHMNVLDHQVKAYMSSTYSAVPSIILLIYLLIGYDQQFCRLKWGWKFNACGFCVQIVASGQCRRAAVTTNFVIGNRGISTDH